MTYGPREAWKPYGDGQYLVSNHGRVYTHDRLIRTVAVNGRQTYRLRRGRLLSLNVAPTGYLRANLYGRPRLVHQVVAELFIANPDNLKTVNHKDGDKQNNRVDNLEWMSSADNTKHAHETGLYGYYKQVTCLETGEKFNSVTEAARSRDLAPGNLCSHLRGRQQTFGGHRWAYL